MQAITIAIGKTGIDFFARELVANELVTILSGLKPPDKNIKIALIKHVFNYISYAQDIVINLTQGKLLGLATGFKSISQQTNGDFTVVMVAGAFSASYKWEENYHFVYCEQDSESGYPPVCTDEKIAKTLTYTPDFTSLTIDVPLHFKYDSQKKQWSIVAGNSSGNAVRSAANIPNDSVIQEEDQECFSSHVSDATAAAISVIDFGSRLNSLIAGFIKSIPASGNLGNGIVYDFSLSDPSQLVFPNNDGIQMGVKGGASYNGAPFSGDTPPSLPLPLPPSDGDAHHLNIYVSNYEVDALHWAYFSAGKLKTTVTPSDLPKDPQALKVSTYVDDDKALRPYHTFAMYADISPAVAPVTAFGAVWDFTDDVVKFLKTKLPSNLSDFLEGIRLNVFASKSQLEDYMKDADVNPEYFKTIEDAAQQMGMVVSSKLNFDLIIQGKEKPDIKFSLARTDVLTNLRLGIGGNKAQTMQYVFLNATYDVEFISTTVPGLSGANFGRDLWRRSGEPQYIAVLNHMGETGVPLPIMEDFQFDFAAAQLSIQEGYISILANVLYKNS